MGLEITVISLPILETVMVIDIECNFVYKKGSALKDTDLWLHWEKKKIQRKEQRTKFYINIDKYQME